MTTQYTNRGTGKARPSQKYGSRGITVIELMITLSIVAITLSLAVPGYSSLLDKNDISAAVNQLHTSLNLARIEAVKRRQAVRLCPSADGATCDDKHTWSGGWLVFEDVNSNGAAETSEIIRVVDSLQPGIAVESAGTNMEYLQFEPTGIARGNAGHGGEFRICHLDSNAYSQVIEVSAAGQVSLRQRLLTDCSKEV